MEPQHAAIIRRVADEQQQTIEVRIAKLQGAAPLDGLNVAKPSLRLDG